jgi:hypothetical protein
MLSKWFRYGSADSGCYESRHLPGRLKVAPYEVRGRIAKNQQSRAGTAEFSLGSLVAKRSLPVAGDKPSVVPAGTEFLFDQPYPGLTRPGLLSCRPFGTAARQAIFSVFLKTYLNKSDIADQRY